MPAVLATQFPSQVLIMPTCAHGVPPKVNTSPRGLTRTRCGRLCLTHTSGAPRHLGIPYEGITDTREREPEKTGNTHHSRNSPPSWANTNRTPSASSLFVEQKQRWFCSVCGSRAVVPAPFFWSLQHMDGPATSEDDGFEQACHWPDSCLCRRGMPALLRAGSELTRRDAP